MSKFSYIVTIHNSEEHLKSVLSAIQMVKTGRSEVYCVLDGCTDGSEVIVDYYGFKKIYTNDVRETMAIVEALKVIHQPPDHYNIILQDDVVLLDNFTEGHILKAYEQFPDIGVLGFRHGANFEPDVLVSKKHSSEMDLIQNIYQPPIPNVPLMEEGYVTERQIVYKSPICISSEVVKRVGVYDKRFIPIAHDDTEYCIRTWIEGYKNYVCSLEVLQPLHWGGTRRFTEVHSDNLKMHEDHMNLIRKLYPSELKYLSTHHPPLTQKKLW